MTGTLAQARIQLQNAESSILFMQQEHARTLQGLYAEINKLQKKCGELTFRLAINATSSSSDEGQVRKELGDSQKILNELKAENVELKGVIEVGNKRVVVLEGQLYTLEQKYKQDLSEKELKIATLSSELDKKSDTVAYLTSQLHHSKLKQSVRYQEDRRKKEAIGATTEIAASSISNVKAPVPPREGTPSNVRRPFRRTVTSPAPQDVGVLNKPKSSRAVGIQASPNEIQLNIAAAKSSHGMPSRPKRAASPHRPGLGIAKGLQRSAGRDRPLPDEYVEFLKTGNRAEPQIVVRAAPEPLPPISANERLAGTPKSPYAGRVQMNRGHSSQGVPTAIYAMGPDGDGHVPLEDVGKIIVSPLSSPEKGWRHKQQPQQQNGPD